jgi:long-chain acyl-CoA synthetase
MDEMHLARILRNRTAKYGDREALRYKENNEYKSISWNVFSHRVDAVAKYLLADGFTSTITWHHKPELSGMDHQRFCYSFNRAVSVPVLITASMSQLDFIATETEMKAIFVGDDSNCRTLLNCRLPLVDCEKS